MGVLTRGGLRRRLLFLVAFAAAVVVATGTFAFAQPGGGGSGFDLNIFGTMTLELADGGQQVTFAPAPPQPITVNRGCELDPVAGPLLSIDATGGALGTFDGDIGVKGRGKAGNGQPCGQVNSTAESLTARLGNDDPLLDGLSIAYLDLGVEAKFNVTVKVVFLDENGNEYADAQGDPIAYTFTPSEDSDSGPDSADSYIEPSIGPGFGFHGVRLEVDESAPDAAFSLETTVFHLTDDITGVLDCDDSVTEDNVTFARTTPASADCVLIPYLLRIDSDEVFLDKDLSQVDAGAETFTSTIEWDAEPKPAPVPDGNGGYIFDLPVTQIDFGAGLVPAEFCPDGSTPTDPWCLDVQNIDSNDDGTVSVTETYRGSGDPRWAR